jgi:hypothetical protein
LISYSLLSPAAATAAAGSASAPAEATSAAAESSSATTEAGGTAVAVHARAAGALVHIAKRIAAVAEIPGIKIPIPHPVRSSLTAQIALSGPTIRLIRTLKSLSRSLTALSELLSALAHIPPTALHRLAVRFAQALLNLACSRPVRRVHPIARVVSIGHVSIAIGDACAMTGIMLPHVVITRAHAVEVISVDEIVVDEHVIVAPAGIPSPAPAPDCSDSHPGAERDRAGSEDRTG